MSNDLLLYLFIKLELLLNLVAANKFFLGEFTLKYLIFFVVIAKTTSNIKIVENIRACRHYRQVLSDELFADMVDQIKKIHGI